MARRKSIRKQLREELDKITNPKTIKRKSLKDFGDGLIDLMKDNIKKGISPISGRRFKAYKNPNKYPGKLKRPRPVNLFLSGKFLKSLVSKPKTGNRPKVTITFKTRESKLMEQGHREGVGGQPKRPIIPARNEKYSRKIQREADKLLLRILKRIFD